MEEKEKCCRTCEYHEHEDFSDGFVCVCAESYRCADWTDMDYSCSYWEKKQEGKS